MGVVERALLVQVHLLDAEGGPVDPQVPRRVQAAADAASPVAEFRRRVLDGAEIAEDGKMRPYLAQQNTVLTRTLLYTVTLKKSYTVYDYLNIILETSFWRKALIFQTTYLQRMIIV